MSKTVIVENDPYNQALQLMNSGVSGNETKMIIAVCVAIALATYYSCRFIFRKIKNLRGNHGR